MRRTEIVGQVLAYKDWVEKLSRDRIVSLANHCLSAGLEIAVRQRFKRHLPKTLNRNQRVIVVAKEFDLPATRAFQQVAKHGVNIKMVTFWTYRERGGIQYIVSSIQPPKDLIVLKLSLAKGMNGCATHKDHLSSDGETVQITRTKQYSREYCSGQPIPKAAPEK